MLYIYIYNQIFRANFLFIILASVQQTIDLGMGQFSDNFFSIWLDIYLKEKNFII